MFGNNYASLKELYQCELTKKGVIQSDIDFVISLIEESDLDDDELSIDVDDESDDDTDEENSDSDDMSWINEL